MTWGSRLRAWLALAMLAPLILVACGGQDHDQGTFRQPATPGTGDQSPLTLEITPAPEATDLPISTEIGAETNGEITDVALVADGDDRVDGAMRADRSTWVPDRPLDPSTGYTATVTVAAADGRTITEQTSFTTMAAPAERTGTGLYLFDGEQYGVAMPVVVEFVQPVPEEARAQVEQRMFVTTDPHQPGVWSWTPDGGQAFYRAKDYWKPGTTIDVRIGLDGHPTGDGRYGDQDRRAAVTIGRHREVVVDNDGKQMTVTEDGEQVRTIPVSLGKPSTPSSYGTMVIMSKERETVFDTFDELGPEEGYRTDIEYAMRLTWGGEFIHAAPWSVADQGVRNVSHGCINMSMSDAQWLFDSSLIGDPVTVRGTERELAHGNGWTAWNLDWEQFVEGSALPAPDDDLLASPPR